MAKWRLWTKPGEEWWRGSKKEVIRDLKRPTKIGGMNPRTVKGGYKELYSDQRFKVKAVQGPLREGQSKFGRPFQILTKRRKITSWMRKNR